MGLWYLMFLLSECTKDKNNFCYQWGDKMKKNICVSSDLDVDTLDWEFLSIIGLWQQFYFITNYQSTQYNQPTRPANSSSEPSDLILFLSKNCHNILSRQPATILPPVPQPGQCEAAGWLVRGQAASDWSRGRGRGWQGERLAWYWRSSASPGSATSPGFIGQIMGSLQHTGRELELASW